MISIIVPVYKAEAFLSQCVDSILQQTYGQYELILVDDGSADNCPAMCDAYAKQDNRIKVIHQVNGGVACAVIAGINAACGEYLFFVDSDDWIDPTMLEQMHTIMLSGAYELVACSCVKENPTGSTKIDGFCARPGAYQQQQIKDEILPGLVYYSGKAANSISISRWGKLFRRDLVLRNLPHYNTGISNGEDWLISIPYIMSCSCVYLMPDAYLYHYRTNLTSITLTYNPKLFTELCKLRLCVEQIIEALAPDKEMFCEQIKLMHLNQAYYAIQIMRRQLLSRPIKEMQRIISEIVSHPSLDRSIMDRSLPHIMQLQFRLIQHKNAYTLYWLNWLMEKRRLWRQRNER